MNTLTIKERGSGAEIELDGVRMMSDRALSEAHESSLSKTPRTRRERQKICAIMQEIQRRGRLRR